MAWMIGISQKLRVFVPLALAAAVAACSQNAPPPTAEAPKPAAPDVTPVSPPVQAMDTDKLRDRATQALRENRMYAPAGDNAMEYYLALRDKQPDNAAVISALTDLMPYTLIATEQNIARENFEEAQRLYALIEKTDPNAPALPRLKSGIAAAMQAAVMRTQAETERVQKEAQKKAQQLAEQRRAAAQQAAEAQAAQQIAAEQEAARRESERQAAAQREAQEREEREEAERAAATTPPSNTATTATTPPAASALRRTVPALHAISTPAPNYPPEALRTGIAGEVLVEITVGTDGSVTSARILHSSPAHIFDREALNATRRWQFEPVDAPVTTRRTVMFNPGN